MSRNRHFYFIVSVLLFFIVLESSAQKKTKEQLNKEKTENLRKIKEAETILAQTERKKRATIGQLNALNQQIRTRESLINFIEEEIDCGKKACC